MNPSVAISLVVYNGEAYLKRCLASIDAQTYREYTLTIIDNGSRDGSLALVKEYAPRAQLICEAENTGFSRAHNRVIRSTNAEFILILNQDCELELTYLERCVRAMRDNITCASVTGSLMRMHGLTSVVQNGSIDTLGLCIHRTFHISNLGAGLPAAAIPQASFTVFGVSATAALYRRTALDDVAYSKSGYREYFDEDFFMYKEDVDIAFRLHQKGWRARCEVSARGHHVRSTSSLILSRAAQTINFFSYRNHFLFLIKNMTRSIALRYGLYIVVYEWVKLTYIALTEPRTLRAIPAAWALRARMKAKRPRSAGFAARFFFGCSLRRYED